MLKFWFKCFNFDFKCFNSSLFWCNIGFWMIKIKRNCKEIEGSLSERKRSENRAKTEQKQCKNRGLRDFAASAKSKFCCETSSQPNCPLCENFRSCETTFGTRVPLRSTGAPISQLRSSKAWKFPNSQPKLHLAGYFAVAKPILAHECHFAAQWISFRSCEKKKYFAAKAPFCRVFRSCETTFGTRVPFRNTVTLISQLRNGCKTSTPQNPSARTPWADMSQPHPHFGNCWTHLDHFLKFKLCMQYLVGNLGKSREIGRASCRERV